MLYQQNYDETLAKEETDDEAQQVPENERGGGCNSTMPTPISVEADSQSPEVPSLTGETTVENSGLSTPRLSVSGGAAGMKRKNPFVIAAALTGLCKKAKSDMN